MKKTTKKKLIMGAFRFADSMSYKDIGAYASSTAFFFFVAIIPLLILLTKLLPLTGITDEQLIHIITGITPDYIDGMISLIIRQAYASSVGVISVSAVFLTYATAKGVLALLWGLNCIYEVKNKRGTIIATIRAVIYTFIMVLIFTLLLVLIVFGEEIVEFFFIGVLHYKSIPIVYSLRYLFMMAIGTLGFMVLYSFIPDERQPFKKQFPGAVFASLAWIVFSFVFSIFINSSIYSTYYGSLAVVVVFMMWLYGCFYILLIGAAINHSFYIKGRSALNKAR
ncbi:MAG: YihY/virulence factor BrkB family protein [Lachnospiraceae bacterium]|nr:YihY/virulence factor BrkB family protein [Lachnospiraceae bacterium]